MYLWQPEWHKNYLPNNLTCLNLTTVHRRCWLDQHKNFKINPFFFLCSEVKSLNFKPNHQHKKKKLSPSPCIYLPFQCVRLNILCVVFQRGLCFIMILTPFPGTTTEEQLYWFSNSIKFGNMFLKQSGVCQQYIILFFFNSIEFSYICNWGIKPDKH